MGKHAKEVWPVNDQGLNLEVISRLSEQPHQKPALLFIHGGFHGAWCWDEFFLPYFQAHGWDAHAVSLRGHGQSEGADQIKSWKLEDYASDVSAAIDQINRPVVLIGHSMGGVVAQRFWREEQRRTLGMVLLASSPLRPAQSVIRRLMTHHPISMIVGQLTKNPALMRKAMTPFFLSPAIAKQDAERYHSQLSLESPAAMAEVFSRPRPEPLDGDERPVLVIAGREDWSIPLKDHEIFVEVYGATFKICPGYHDLMLDPAWEESAGQIKDWLESHSFDS